jgi:hypothetical protein
MTFRSALTVVGSLLALALTTGCNPPQRDGADFDDTQRQSGAGGPVEYTRGGVTVRLPHGCSPKEITPGTCSGLRSLRLAERGPLDDLMRPGVYEREGTWVGLRLVEGSFVFAEAGNEEVISELLASASPAAT